MNSKWSYFIVSKLIVRMLHIDKNMDNHKDHMYRKLTGVSSNRCSGDASGKANGT